MAIRKKLNIRHLQQYNWILSLVTSFALINRKIKMSTCKLVAKVFKRGVEAIKIYGGYAPTRDALKQT